MQKQLLDHVRQIRDEQRPKMEDVVSVLEKLIATVGQSGGTNFQQVLSGPETWSWVDLSNADLGYERWYVLTGSAMEGAEGYPLFTIRSSVAPRLDSCISVSQLVVGPEARSIETSITMAIINHQAAFEGLKQSISDLLAIMTAGRSVPVVGDVLSSPTGVSVDPKKDMN